MRAPIELTGSLLHGVELAAGEGGIKMASLMHLKAA